MIDLAAILKKERKIRHMTQPAMAKFLEIGYRTYQDIEKTGVVKKTDDFNNIIARLQIREPEAKLSALKYDRKDAKLQSRKNTVPFYDAQAVGGITETEMTPIHAPAGTIDVGDLLHDCSAAIRIYGNSMITNYPPGCVVGLQPCTTSFIEPGEVYVIETKDRRMLKRLFYKNDDPASDTFMCYSDNTMVFEGGARHGKLAYPPFDIHKKEVHKLFSVTGVIKRNTNSIIMNR